jgi:hypothetical protein
MWCSVRVNLTAGADAAFRRACAAVDDLDTATLMNRLYR